MHNDTRPQRDAAWLGAVLAALVYPTLFTGAYFILLAHAPRGVQGGVYSAGKLLQFAFPVLWVLCVGAISNRPMRVVGRLEIAPTKTAHGLLFGAAVLGLMLLGYHAWLRPTGLFAAAGEAVRAKVAGFGIDTPGKFFALGLFYCLLHSFLEEYYWRWFVFGGLRRWLSLWPAAVVSSIGFAGHHVVVLATYFGWLHPATIVFSLAVAAGGGFWAWLYARGGSLLGPWLSHLLIDAAIFLIGYDLIFG